MIGSGIGGLSTAAILAKSGKKVLVLEQHDQVNFIIKIFKRKIISPFIYFICIILNLMN